MPDPIRYTKYLIGVKSGTGTVTVGTRCKITNFTAGNTITGVFKSNDECVLNPDNFNREWSIGNILMVEISGIVVGSKQITLTRGGIKTTVTTATEDIVAVDL